MQVIHKIKCQSCGHKFQSKESEMEFVDNSPEAEFFKVNCPSCGFENKLKVGDLQNRGKNVLYDVGGVIFYFVNFFTFLGMTPQGWVSMLVLFGAGGMIHWHPYIGIPALILALVITGFLYSMWSKGDVKAEDFSGE